MQSIIRILRKVKATFKSILINIPAFIYKRLPLKDEVFFYSIRSNDKLTENAKLVYDELGTDNKRYFAKLLPHSLLDAMKIQYYLLTRKVIVTDDYLKYVRFFSLRKEQTLIQIWHAAGAFKKFGLDADRRLNDEGEKRTHQFYDAVTVSSEYVRPYYASAFGIDISKILPLGVARTDILVNEASKAVLQENIYIQHPEYKGKKIYLYCPTFRENEELLAVDIDPQINWQTLDNALNDDELFLLRPHPITKKQLVPDGLKHIAETWLPTTDLIACACVVITDYSSVIYDSLLANVPIVLYCPDFDDYNRDFYLNFPEDIPALCIKTDDKLLTAIRETIKQPPVEKTAAFKENQLGACDGQSTQRIVQLIQKVLLENK